MFERPKCHWCGDSINRGLIRLQSDVYHVKCIPETLLCFELSEIRNALKELKSGGTDVSKVVEIVDDLADALKTIS